MRRNDVTACIAVDLMGSDTGNEVIAKGISDALKQLPTGFRIELVGTSEVLNALPDSLQSLEKVQAGEVISMNDSPLLSVRRKQSSSMMICLRLLKDRKVDAVVTAGNTGALIAGASLLLPHIDGVERPALLALVPTKQNSMAVVDVGGNISSTSKQLVQFACMGIVFQRCYLGIEKARVGLLNIGIESKKGTEELKKAYQFLSESDCPYMEFLGNIEGREVFEGNIDVLVTDGFAGNIFLKTSEGVSLFILEMLLKQFDQFHEEFSRFKMRFDYSEYPGALLCGIEGIVIKSHGNSSTSAITKSILSAASLVQNEFVSKASQIMRERN